MGDQDQPLNCGNLIPPVIHHHLLINLITLSLQTHSLLVNDELILYVSEVLIGQA